MTLRGALWTVVQSTTHADCETLALDQVAGPRSQTFLLPFDRPVRAAEKRLTVVSALAWLHALEQALLDVYPYGGLRHYADTVDVLPYQLEPALAMLRDGHSRVIVADDVGMGKTIEAGTVVRELSQRDVAFRSLILVPAGLREQWAQELATRFQISALAVDAGWLRDAGAALAPNVNPWSLPGTYVASLDFIKRPEVLRALEDVRWDLLIVDEAHGAAVATDRRAAADAIGVRAQRVLLLTGTPPVERSQFDALCRIGDVPGGACSVLFRRSRPAGAAGRRRSVVLAARISNDEHRMHRMIERYTTLMWRESKRAGNAHGRLAATILRKRALSSAASLQASLLRRQDLLSAVCVPPELQLLLPLDEDVREDLVGDELLGASGLSDLHREQRWLAAVVAAASAAAVSESKVRLLVRLLLRIDQPAIVFTEYRDTLEQLRRVLVTVNIPVSLLHGGLSDSERRHAIAEFSAGGRILLATDAAAEGLNLQRACRVIVHYELPWNPSRMLQRAGRVDRLGQRRRVHEIALVASDTAEALVLAPLARRAMTRPGAIGGARMLELLTESRVAEVIFDGTPPDLPEGADAPIPCVPADLAGEALSEAFRLEERRALSSAIKVRGARRESIVPVTTLRRSSLERGVILLFDVETGRPNGQPLERSLGCIHLALERSGWPRARRLLRDRLAGILPALLAAAAPTLDALRARQLAALETRYFEARRRELDREAAMMSIQRSAARELVQAGLFDRRASRIAAHQRDGTGFLEQDEQRSDRADALVSSATLRAVLLVDRR